MLFNKKYKKLCAIILASSHFANSLMACTVFPRNVLNEEGQITNVVVGRTYDLGNILFNNIAFGAKDERNISDVNFYSIDNDKVAKWKNIHQFIGKTTTGNNTFIVDGINEAGLYVGYLNLPNVTEYPEYNTDDARPALSIFNVINYLLGMAASVDESLNLLKNNVQIVNSAFFVGVGEIGVFCSGSLHIALKDKTGNNAVIEFLKGKVVYHERTQDTVIEGIEKKGITVLTNSPDYDFQVKNFQDTVKKYNFQPKNNHNYKVDGLYMNGSGLVGLPGDKTPPSRFALAQMFLSFLPTATNVNDAKFIANSILGHICVPLGTNPDPTLWVSMCDLGNAQYFYKNLVHEAFFGKYEITEDCLNTQWNTISVKDVTPELAKKNGWVTGPVTRTWFNVKSITINDKGTGADTSYESSFFDCSVKKDISELLSKLFDEKNIVNRQFLQNMGLKDIKNSADNNDMQQIEQKQTVQSSCNIF